jgi:hypothetical protein
MLSTPKTFEKQSAGDASSAEQIEQHVFFLTKTMHFCN